MRSCPTSGFQLLAPLVVSRDPVGVRRLLVRYERGELTFQALLADLESLPMSNRDELLTNLYGAADAYDESIARMRREGTVESVAAKNGAWSKLQRARAAIQDYIRR